MKPSSSTFFQPKRKMFTVEGFRRVLLKLLVKRDIPFSFVEYPETAELFAYIDPGCSSVSRSSIMKDMEEIYFEKFEELKSRITSNSSKV